MITYYGRFGKYLGQADAVPANAPLVRAPERVDPQPIPVVVENTAKEEVPSYEQPIRMSKAGLIAGGLAVALLAVTLWSSMRK